MKVLLSWMQEFAPVTGEPHEIADQLTALGLVVESVEAVGASWDGIVVAQVTQLSPHPQADKIQLVNVDVGDGQPLQICCGAFNMGVGDKVPLATIGTTMPNGLEIAQRRLRGEMSNGMICSGSELELTDDSEGIMILDSELKLGEPLAVALGASADVLFDIDVEGNRPDALSVAGVARDLAAKQGVPFSHRQISLVESGVPAADLISVSIQDGDLCPRFGARVLTNVTMGASPAWMAQRLAAAGMRPINVIVDISNYVMLELGQPNHTYDLSLLPDGVLGVRRSPGNETLVTLDDQERQLVAGDGVITDRDDKPIGLAGVMGGASTEISDGTTSVLLEAAVWDRMTVAHTSRRLALRSEASTRFERGVDHLGIEQALDRFCELAAELTGAVIAPGRIMEDGNSPEPKKVTVRPKRINHILHTDLDAQTMMDYLNPIGFTSVLNGDGTFDTTVPTWRLDASIEEDIAEEIGRHHGYEKSGKRVPQPPQTGSLSAHQLARRRIRRAFAAAGCLEAMPMPFLAPGDLAKAGMEIEGLSLTNPLVAEESILRTSMLPGMLKTLAYNQSHRSGPVKFFELGTVYLPTENELPEEPEQVCAAMSGADAVAAMELLHRVWAELGLRDVRVVNREQDGMHPTRSAEVIYRGRPIGEVGEIDPTVCENFDVAGRVAWLRLDVTALFKGMESVAKAKPVSRYPSSDIDLAFLVPAEVAATAVADVITKAGQPLVNRVHLFDVFRSDELGSDVRSLAYSVSLQAMDRTLTDDEVSAARDKMISEVSKKFKATLR